MSREPIREGFDVFVHDGDKAVGAVRRVSPREITVYVENTGDFIVPLSSVQEVSSGKVTLNCAKLDAALKRAIGHAHAGEDPNI